jgi:outer membrane lipoprotein carrier protein
MIAMRKLPPQGGTPNTVSPNTAKRSFSLRRAGTIFLFTVLALLPLLPSASRATRAAAQQDELNSIIDGLQKKYAKMTGLAADFVQVYQGVDGRTIKESGRLLLKRPGKARWDYASPERKIFLADGKNIFFHVYGEPQATKASIKESADPQIPFLFLLGRGNLRRDFSRIELLSEERAVEAGNKMLRLIPNRAPEEFKKLLVEVNPVSFQVKRLVIFERNGARMDFTLTNTQENFAAADSEFRFTPPPGVTIRQQ